MATRIFGHEAKIRGTNLTASKKAQFVVLRGLYADYDNDSLREEISTEYPSLNGILSLTKVDSRNYTKMYPCHSATQ